MAACPNDDNRVLGGAGQNLSEELEGTLFKFLYYGHLTSLNP